MEIMQIIIDFAYSRNAAITDDNVDEVMAWSHYFGYASLVDLCAKFMYKNLTVENCISKMQMTKYTFMNFEQ